jgi:hypothetical protein
MRANANANGPANGPRDAIEAKGEISAVLRWEIDYYFGCLQTVKHALKTDKRI